MTSVITRRAVRIGVAGLIAGAGILLSDAALAQDYGGEPPPSQPTPTTQPVQVLPFQQVSPEPPTVEGGLPVTGSDVVELVAIGTVLLAGGGALVTIRRSRAQAR